MKNNKGFTLIELLVVVLIIGILAAIALPQYFKAVEKSRMAEAQTVMGSVNHAQAVFLMGAQDQYAAKFNQLDIDLPGGNPNSDTYTTDLFTYTIQNPTTTPTARIIAVRKTGDATVGLFFGDGHICCTGNICASLGNGYNSTTC